MPFQSVNLLLQNSFRENWDREALSNYQGTTLTYGEVATRIVQLHLCFKKYGLEKGEKVAICSRNQANWGVCFLAAMTYGAVPVPILHEFKPENIHYLVNHCDAQVLFVDDVTWENLSESEMPSVKVVVLINTLTPLYSSILNVASAREDVLLEYQQLYPEGLNKADLNFHKDSADELAVINYTSGTSGFSKGVMIPYRALWCNIAFAGEYAEPQLSCESEVVAILPSAHMYGLMYEFLYEMTIGAHVHFLNRIPSPKIILGAFAQINPDIIISVPLIIEKVYKSQIKPIIDSNKLFIHIPFLDQFFLKKIRKGMIDAFGGRFEEIILGGAPFNPEVEAFLRKIHFPFTVGYGMTECSPLITFEKWYRTKLGSCGKPIAGCEIRIDSKDPQNIPGEIQIKGDNVFLGYYKNQEATEQVFTSDNWFRTGDIGIMDEDGFLFLRGRSKCMILGPSGQNIYPEELEAIINNLTYVVESLVVEEKCGALTALIFPDYKQAAQDGMERKELEERMRMALPEINKRLPSYARIRNIELMPEDFERTPKRSIKRYLYQRS